MEKVKNIVCLGAGYVGGPTMTVMAKHNPKIQFYVTDQNKDRIKAWNSENLPVFEPGLYDIVKEIRGKNLYFEVIHPELLKKADMVFVCVGTPTKNYGEGKGMAADLQYLELAVRDIEKYCKDGTIIVEKSTVPVKTAEAIRNIVNHQDSGKKYEVLSNPEFLAEGTAIRDLEDPDRVLIGHSETDAGQEAGNTLRDLYAAWVKPDKILLTNVWSSELSKLTANAFLAQRVSSINSISALCEKTNASISEISRAIGTDSRIGSKFLQASVGFGGSCFKKDILSLVYICEQFGLSEVAQYWRGVISMNEYQTNRFVREIIERQFNTVAGKKIAILGFAFKPDTNDTRESPAIYVCKKLIEEKAKLFIHDPKALENAKKDLKGIDESVTYTHQIEEAIEDAHAIVILTQWKDYYDLDYAALYRKMKKPAFIFDGRNVIEAKKLYEIGFNVIQIGRKALMHFE
ncbi:MAG: nucleotide sugar dehydrogenase [Candidatus Hydrogenedentota bacterium]|nr:MAG: nucleotide sugar dehydrogenase [Candidatus Hydrogenedentota bacterium]